MPESSRRFGLMKLVNDRDNVSLANHKFTDADRSLVDRLLAYGVEAHVHDAAVAPVAADLTMPTLAGSDGGMLPGGVVVHYRYTYVDVAGNETLASPVASAVTAEPVVTPAAPIVTPGTTGTLPAGRYAYVVSAYSNDDRHETLPSPPAVAVLHSVGGVSIQLPTLPSGADGWNIYRSGPAESRFHYLTSALATDATVDDQGAYTAEARVAPTKNTSGQGSSITVTIAAPPSGYTWRLYRTYDPSRWTNSLLAHLASGTTYEDIGLGAGPGEPLARSAAVSGAPKIELTDAAHVQGALPPGTNVIPYEVVFQFGSSIFSEPSGVDGQIWVNEFEYADIIEIYVTSGVGQDSHDTIFANIDKYMVLGDYWENLIGTGLLDGEESASDSDNFVPQLTQGDILRARVTPLGATVDDLSVTVLLLVAHGSQTQTMEWT